MSTNVSIMDDFRRQGRGCNCPAVLGGSLCGSVVGGGSCAAIRIGRGVRRSVITRVGSCRLRHVGIVVPLVVHDVVAVAHGGSSHIGRANVWRRRSKTAGNHFCVRCSCAFWLPLPELALPEAGSVIVGGAGAIALFLLMMPNQGDLHQGSDDEDQGAYEGYRKRRRVQATSRV